MALVRELELCDPQVLSPRQWAFCLPKKETKRIKQVDMCIALPTQSSTSFSVLQSRPALTSKNGFHSNGSETHGTPVPSFYNNFTKILSFEPFNRVHT